MKSLGIAVTLCFLSCSARIPSWIHRVSSCPMPNNITDWERASEELNCDDFNSVNPNSKVYHCMPSGFLNETVEFCSKSLPNGGGNCPVYRYKFQANTAPDFESCSGFRSGCPSDFYFSKTIYKYPACLNINKIGLCYEAIPTCCTDQSCSNFDSSSPETTFDESWILPVFVGVGVLVVAVAATVVFAIRRRRRANQNRRHGWNTDEIGTDETEEEGKVLYNREGKEVDSPDIQLASLTSTSPVLDRKETALTLELSQILLRRLKSYSPPGDLKYFDILLLGPIGTGKSSYVNACLTAAKKSKLVSTAVLTGPISTASITTKLNPYQLTDLDKIRLFDCPGMFERKDIGLEEVKLIIEGNIRPTSTIATAAEMKRDENIYRENPSKGDLMHVVVLVLKHGQPIERTQQITDLQKLLESLGTTLFCMYTFVDEIDGVTDDVERVFQNDNVKREREFLSDVLKIDQKFILPMSNYHGDEEVRNSKNALALHNLSLMVFAAYDSLHQTVNVPADFYS